MKNVFVYEHIMFLRWGNDRKSARNTGQSDTSGHGYQNVGTEEEAEHHNWNSRLWILHSSLHETWDSEWCIKLAGLRPRWALKQGYPSELSLKVATDLGLWIDIGCSHWTTLKTLLGWEPKVSIILGRFFLILGSVVRLQQQKTWYHEISNRLPWCSETNISFVLIHRKDESFETQEVAASAPAQDEERCWKQPFGWQKDLVRIFWCWSDRITKKVKQTSPNFHGAVVAPCFDM